MEAQLLLAELRAELKAVRDASASARSASLERSRTVEAELRQLAAAAQAAGAQVVAERETAAAEMDALLAKLASACTAEEEMRRQAAQQLETEQERHVARLQQMAARRMHWQRLNDGWSTWRGQWAEVARHKRLLAQAKQRCTELSEIMQKEALDERQRREKACQYDIAEAERYELDARVVAAAEANRLAAAAEAVTQAKRAEECKIAELTAQLLTGGGRDYRAVAWRHLKLAEAGCADIRWRLAIVRSEAAQEQLVPTEVVVELEQEPAVVEAEGHAETEAVAEAEVEGSGSEAEVEVEVETVAEAEAEAEVEAEVEAETVVRMKLKVEVEAGLNERLAADAHSAPPPLSAATALCLRATALCLRVEDDAAKSREEWRAVSRAVAQETEEAQEAEKAAEVEKADLAESAEKTEGAEGALDKTFDKAVSEAAEETDEEWRAVALALSGGAPNWVHAVAEAARMYHASHGTALGEPQGVELATELLRVVWKPELEQAVKVEEVKQAVEVGDVREVEEVQDAESEAKAEEVEDMEEAGKVEAAEAEEVEAVEGSPDGASDEAASEADTNKADEEVASEVSDEPDDHADEEAGSEAGVADAAGHPPLLPLSVLLPLLLLARHAARVPCVCVAHVVLLLLLLLLLLPELLRAVLAARLGNRAPRDTAAAETASNCDEAQAYRSPVTLRFAEREAVVWTARDSSARILFVAESRPFSP